MRQSDVTRLTRYRFLSRLTVAVLAALIGLVGAWQAANAAEPRDPIQREDIALIETQLDRIEKVVDRLADRQQAQPNRRVILDVYRLRSDINDIRNGLRAYLAPPRLPPREPPPLSGKYLSQRPGLGQ